MRCPIAAPTEAMPRRRRPKVGASPSRRSTRFEFRLATHLLRERLDVGLRYVGVGSCAAFGGRTPFDAVDRSALFVRPIDCRREAALAQAGQRCACRVRKPPRHFDQFVNRRAAVPLKQFDDLRQLRPAPRSGGGRGPFSPADEGSGAECSCDDERAGATSSRKSPSSSTCPGSALLSITIAFAPAAVSLQRIGQPGLVIAPPDRRSRLRPDLLYEAGADQFASDFSRRGDFQVRRGDKTTIVALRSGAQHHELRVGELDGHG